jgi:hypothetical protein
MACSKRGVPGRTVLLGSASALSLLKIHFCMSSRSQIKRERFGTILMTVSSSMATYKFTLINAIFFLKKATQYCDGLRGALIVYDPKDPYLNM